jgi:hypothetical protein
MLSVLAGGAAAFASLRVQSASTDVLDGCTLRGLYGPDNSFGDRSRSLGSLASGERI